jgi:nucleoid DNA-binding protein
MTRKELSKKWSQKISYEPTASQEVVDAIPTVIFETLKAGEKVKWWGLGTFVPGKRAGRNFYVPPTKS